MQIKANLGIKLHNRFDFIITDTETGKVDRAYAELAPQAENIVLDRIYSRLLNFQSYFDHIVFGTGTGALSVARTTLFNRLGSKPAQPERLVRDYPTSILTKMIRLESGEYNGNILTEVGISETTTNINTHALITDSEGNPLTIEKTSTRIIDIYSSVFAEVYSVDSGCYFYGNGLRDYLTGGAAPSYIIGIGSGANSPDGYPGATLTAIKTSNLTEKSVTFSGKFSVYQYNQDVMAIDWVGGGLRWKLPRVGVHTGIRKTNVDLGNGDGIKTKFYLPQQGVKNLTVKVDGTATAAYTRPHAALIIFDVAPAALKVTADYDTEFIPKDSDHELDIVKMKIVFAGAQPSPVIPDPELPTDLPGPQTLAFGDTDGGYFGEVAAADFISGNDFCELIGLTAGVSQNSDAGWLKYYNNDKISYVAKKTFKHTISWDNINAIGAVFGNKVVAVGNKVFAVRLLSTGEWNKLIYPVHVDFGEWAQFTNAELLVHYSAGNGSYSWTSTPSGSSRVIRGGVGVSNSDISGPSTADSYFGFRPVLEFLYALPS